MHRAKKQQRKKDWRSIPITKEKPSKATNKTHCHYCETELKPESEEFYDDCEHIRVVYACEDRINFYCLKKW